MHAVEFRISSFVLRVFGFRISGFGARTVTDFGFRVSGLGFRGSHCDIGFRVSGIKFRGSHRAFEEVVHAMGFRISGFRSRVPDFGFQIPGFEFRVYIDTSLIKKCCPPWNQHRGLGIGLL